MSFIKRIIIFFVFRTIAPYACTICTNVIFCSIKCRDIATNTYHQFECGILNILWKSGSSINCHMALRMISQKSPEYFQNIENDLKNGVKFEETTKYCMKNTYKNEIIICLNFRLPTNDYRKVFNLVRHENTRDSKSFLQYATMAYFLETTLALTKYFNDDERNSRIHDVIGGLILRNLQFLQFNTHEIYELNQSKSDMKTVFIGGGLYPTLALFNHSCNPGIVRYYKGTSVYVHAIANITSGGMIAENYGPLYSQNSMEERKATLKDLYWFDCNCLACREVWPLYDEMSTEELRFK